MGLLVEGQWQDKWYDTAASGGRFQLSASVFRNLITPDGSAGPEGRGGFRAEAGRYHLYVSLACPWAHRTLLMRQLKGLTQLIPVSVVHPLMLENGWTFQPEFSRCYQRSPVRQSVSLSTLYYRRIPAIAAALRYQCCGISSSRPLSAMNRRISCGYSIARSTAPAHLTGRDYYPPDLRAAIDEINGWIYRIPAGQ